MSESNLSAIELKIQKLIAHEQSARDIGSLNEANAFAEKIAGLCEEYGIEISRLAQQGEGPVSVVHREDLTFRELGFKYTNPPLYVARLFHAVAMGNNCRAIRYPGSDRVTLVGHDHDRAVTKELFRQLLTTAIRQSAGHQKNSFINAFVISVNTRLEAARASRHKQYSGESQALIRTYRDDVEKAFRDLFPRVTRQKATIKWDPASHAAGTRAGQRASLGTNQMGQGKGNRLLGS